MFPTSFLKALEKAIVRDNVDLVIIDPLASAGGLRDENNNAEMGALATRLRTLAGKTGCALLLVHHTTKEGSGSLDTNAGRGAGALKSAMRWIVSFRKKADNWSVIEAAVTKNTHGGLCDFSMERLAGGVVRELNAKDFKEREEAESQAWIERVPQLVQFMKDNPRSEITRGGINNGQGYYVKDLLKNLFVDNPKDALKVVDIALNRGDVVLVSRQKEKGECLALP